MKHSPKKRASAPKYVSPQQIILPGFESPFSQKLNPSNRWIILAHKIPWDSIAGIYKKQMSGSAEGRPPLSARIVIGALIIKHLNNYSDEETVLQIQENMYLQYFVGYSSFTCDPVFDPSLFVEIRKRMGDEQINKINEQIVELHLANASKKVAEKPASDAAAQPKQEENKENRGEESKCEASIAIATAGEITHHGRMITDATVSPQDIAFPTDVSLLSDAREKSEELIDLLYKSTLGKSKPRTYRNLARKEYLLLAKNRNRSRKAIRKAVGKQLRYVKRNIKSIHMLLNAYEQNKLRFPLTHKQQKYLLVIQTLYDQQREMHSSFTHTIEDRIVSIHQPHVRPMVRGKANARVEFGAKIEVTLANGFAFLDDLSWDAFNEGARLLAYVDKYKSRFGYYPKEVLADQIFCSRENRRRLKELRICLIAKPLGRPSKTALKEYVRPGERNPIEGKFGQAKTAYGLARIKARLSQTSQSWIASIILVLNLVKLAGLEKYCQYKKVFELFIEQILFAKKTEFFSRP